MNEAALTREQILDAAGESLRRFGPTKATVLDVARLLAVSHGSVYRHFPSKAALRDAVIERWLAGLRAPLAALAEKKTGAAQGAAVKRLRRWLELLIEATVSRWRDDPEMFAAYLALAADAREGIGRHVEHLLAQLSGLIADAIERGELAKGNPRELARALFDATTLFHHPLHAAGWSEPGLNESFQRVWTLALRGLKR